MFRSFTSIPSVFISATQFKVVFDTCVVTHNKIQKHKICAAIVTKGYTRVMIRGIGFDLVDTTPNQINNKVNTFSFSTGKNIEYHPVNRVQNQTVYASLKLGRHS